MNITPRITTVPPLASFQGPNLELELRLARGPIAIGEPGEGTYRELYSKDYAVFLDETGRLRVYVSTGTSWVPVTEDLYPQPPHPGNQIRHIAACFDQAARLVLAYEINEQVYVYQWDIITNQYVTRGPFPGVDPVLIQDATIGFYPPDSDVLLLHLSTDRTRLIMRVQRELYGTPRQVAVLPGPATLDQAIARPFFGQVVGTYVDSPTSTGFVVNTDLYPVYADERAGGSAVEPPRNWTLMPAVFIYNGGTELAGSSAVTPPVSWNYIPAVVIRDLGTELAALISVTPPSNWNYALAVVIHSFTEDAATALVAPPTSWDYPRLVVVYNGGVEVAASASVSPPTDWNYYV
jgi:hypothetical protein